MITKQQELRIKSGATLVWENEDRSLSADVDKNDKGEFRIWFNGTFVKMGKTLKPIDAKLSDLVRKHKLTFVN